MINTNDICLRFSNTRRPVTKSRLIREYVGLNIIDEQYEYKFYANPQEDLARLKCLYGLAQALKSSRIRYTILHDFKVVDLQYVRDLILLEIMREWDVENGNDRESIEERLVRESEIPLADEDDNYVDFDALCEVDQQALEDCFFVDVDVNKDDELTLDDMIECINQMIEDLGDESEVPDDDD